MATSEQAKNYHIEERTPTPQQYHDLRKISGLTPPPMSPISSGLAGSWFSLVIIHTPTSEVVGMGRLVGDGSLFLQLVDIAVHPSHQGHGLGRMVMECLLAYADEKAPDAYVSLIGDPPANEKFYPRFGFKDVSPSTGMFRYQGDGAREP